MFVSLLLQVLGAAGSQLPGLRFGVFGGGTMGSRRRSEADGAEVKEGCMCGGREVLN